MSINKHLAEIHNYIRVKEAKMMEMNLFYYICMIK